MTSPSTLSRKAAKTNNPVEAKKLRAQAAKLRRQARATTKVKLHPETKQAIMKGKLDLSKPLRNKIYPGFKAELLKQSEQAEKDAAALWSVGWQPHDPVAEMVDGLRNLARGKRPGQAKAFSISLRAKLVDAKVRGKKEAEEANLAILKTIHETNRINVVCAFLSEMEGLASIGNGPLPKVVMVSGFTLARVIDALRDAGYSSEGKGGGIRSRQV